MAANTQLTRWDLSPVAQQRRVRERYWGTFVVLPPILYLFVSPGCEKGCTDGEVKVGLDNYVRNF